MDETISNFFDTSADSKMLSVVFFDGEFIWMSNPVMRTMKIGDSAMADGGFDGQDLPLWLKAWWKKIPKVIVVSFPDKISLSETLIYIEPQKANIIKISKKDSSTVFSEFKEVDNYGEIPYKTTRSIDKEYLQMKEERIIESVLVNQGLSEGLFDKDKIEAEMQKLSTEFMDSYLSELKKIKVTRVNASTQ